MTQTNTNLPELIKNNENKYISAREELHKAYLLAIAPMEKIYNEAKQHAYMVMQIDLIPIEQSYKANKSALESLCGVKQ